MTLSTEAPPWEFGTGALMRNLARRGLLVRALTPSSPTLLRRTEGTATALSERKRT